MARHADPNTYGPADKVLLVEGEDDQHLFWNLLEFHGYQSGVRVTDCKGFPNLCKELRVRLRNRNDRALAVVVDADTEFQNRWQSLRDLLERAGYPNVPTSLSAQGALLAAEDWPTVGIWIMPDNLSEGMMEDFARLLVPPNDPLWKRATDAVEAIPQAERRFGSHVAKARIHTWLAWQETPGEPIGKAIKTRSLQGQAEPAKQLVAWVAALFQLAPATL